MSPEEPPLKERLSCDCHLCSRVESASFLRTFYSTCGLFSFSDIWVTILERSCGGIPCLRSFSISGDEARAYTKALSISGDEARAYTKWRCGHQRRTRVRSLTRARSRVLFH